MINTNLKRKNHEKHKEKNERLLIDLPAEFSILEEGIDFQTTVDYINKSHSFEMGELSEEATLKLGDILNSPATPVNGKKKALSILAHLGSVTAYRQLEKYHRNPDRELKQWSALALQECCMFLESELTDQVTGFISGGLGGNKNSLRFYFLVLPLDGQTFTESQRKVIREEITNVAAELRCVAESFNIADAYAGFTALVPMDVAPGAFVDAGIRKCNELGAFVLEDYYATNQDIPDQEALNEIIRIVRGEKSPPE